MRRVTKQLFTHFLLATCLVGQALAQTEESDTPDLLAMSFEDLMDVRIISASKREENLFNAPLAAAVLRKEDIQKAGCTSIMDAFRLMPSLIVREQSNGNFDIHLRGMNDISPGGTLPTTTNTTTLVMIDGRPVYSYLHGGTFWETLPIDIQDVEKIEVVVGTASALYGPNAVSGVINIITHRLKKNGLYAVANSQVGSYNTYIANTAIGYKFSNRLSAIVSGNLQKRDRTQTSYYETYRNLWIDTPDSLITTRGNPESDTKDKYPDTALAMEKYGLNAFIQYAPIQKTEFTISAGLQDSEVQKVYFENSTTPLTTSASDSRYIDVNARTGNLTSQFSYMGGTYVTQVGGLGQLYDFNNLDVVTEYNIEIKKLSIKPGINVRRATTDDSKYVEELIKTGSYNGSGFNGQTELLTKAIFLRSEYSLLNNTLRLVAGLRVDRFNHPDEPYVSYQFASTYMINKNNILRFVMGRANQSPFINNNYINLTPVRYPFFEGPFPKPGHFVEIRILGNTELKLLTSDMIELGYRSKFSSHVQFEVELFTATNKNFAVPISSKKFIDVVSEGDTVHVSPGRYTNIPLHARQFGGTLSMNYSTSKLLIRPFVTVQRTTRYDFTDYINTSEGTPPTDPETGDPLDPAVHNIYYGLGTSAPHKGTPYLYGGLILNYKPLTLININLNSYFYSENDFSTRVYTEFNDGVRGKDHLTSKVLINASVSYMPLKQLTVFATAKNLLNDDAREFYRTDNIGFMFLLGVQVGIR